MIDVFIEGDLVAFNLDVYKAAGYAGNTAYILTTEDVTVADGSLTINFVGVVQKAKISAIKICSTRESPSEPPTASEYRRRANLRVGYH